LRVWGLVCRVWGRGTGFKGWGLGWGVRVQGCISEHKVGFRVQAWVWGFRSKVED